MNEHPKTWVDCRPVSTRLALRLGVPETLKLAEPLLVGLRREVERVEGIEPSWPAWKAGTLPLSYTREHVSQYSCARGSQSKN